MKFKRAKRAIEQAPKVTDDESAVAHSAGWVIIQWLVPGVPLRSTRGFPLPPRSAG